jgi:hypothetical protein
MKMHLLAAVTLLSAAACSGPANTPAETATGETATTPAETAPAAPAMSAAELNGPIAGKWKVTITSAGMTLPPQEVCYDKQMSLEEAQKMQQQAGVTCSEQSYTPAPGGMTGHSVCMMENMTVTTDMKVTGDFNTAYTMEMTSSMDPAPPGMPTPSTSTIQMERLGDCTAGEAPVPPAN